MIQATRTAPTPTFTHQLSLAFQRHLESQGLRDTEPYYYNVTYREDRNGPILGGLTAHTWGNYFTIDILWLDAKTRGKRVGTTFIGLANREAAKRGCTKGVVMTFTYQAEGLYNKHGFVRDAELSGYFHDKATELFLVKDKMEDAAAFVDEPLPPGFQISVGKDPVLDAFLISGLDSDTADTMGPRKVTPLYIGPATEWSTEKLPFGVAGYSTADVLVISQYWIDPVLEHGVPKADIGRMLVEAAVKEALDRNCSAILAEAFDVKGAIPLEVYRQAGFTDNALTSGWFGSLTRTLMFKRLAWVSA